MEKKNGLVQMNIETGLITSASEYSEFLNIFAHEINTQIDYIEKDMYALGEFILQKCNEGMKRFLKSKDQIFEDICAHPDLKFRKKTLYNYRKTAEFIQQLSSSVISNECGITNENICSKNLAGEKSITGIKNGNKIPFTTMSEIACAKLPHEEKIKIVSEVQNQKSSRKTVRQRIAAKRIELYSPESSGNERNALIPYDIWYFPQCDPRFGEADFPGRIPGQIIIHLIHYYMEGDRFLSVYPGSHTDRDVCIHMGKTCIELKQNVLEPWRIEDESMDFVFHDPPYWHAKANEKEYQNNNDLAQLTLTDFYNAIDFTAKETYRVLKQNGISAFIMGNKRNPYEDLGLRCYLIFEQYLTPIDRIIVPYAGTSSMHTAWAISRAKKGNLLLNGYRDLLVFRKKVKGTQKQL